jgi:uncharacterized repeat protein (TIGR01451 family)
MGTGGKMKTRHLYLGVLAVLIVIALIILFSASALAQDKPTATPTVGKGPATTPASPQKPPLQPENPATISAVDYSTSSFAARGTHPGENSTYTLIIANTGTKTGTATEVNITVPSNANYVSGSAHVQGGGSLSVHYKAIQWAGAVSSGTNITITFHAVLPTAIGASVTANATIFDPGLPASMTLANSLTVQAPSGGPDAFGYTYQDSREQGSGVTFNWIPTTTLSTKLNFGVLPADDVVTGTIPIGFQFGFYKNTYNEMYINSNGLVMFGPVNAANTDNVPKPIPTPGQTDNFASCFWSDLFILDSSQGVWVQTFGTAPNRYTVITFRAAYFPAPYATPSLFQMILYEASNHIKCQYASTGGPFYASGGQAAIGLESDDGTAGISYFFSLDSHKVVIGPLENNLAVEFTPGASPVPVFVTSSIAASANVHPGDVATYTLRIHNNGSASGSSTTLTDPIPAGATYVNGSANVLGGGTLTANGSGVNWSGTVSVSSTVTVTYRVKLPTSLGSVLVNTATIADPQAVAPYVMKNSDLRVLPAPTGGPDAFGYTYKDSYASGGGVTYSWIPTTTFSTKLNFGVLPADDVFTGTIAIGFPFRFYSGVYNDFYVSSNGLVSFGAGSENNINTPIPNPGDGADNFAACFWGDLFIQDAYQGVWVETTGSAPNRETVITFRTQYFVTSADKSVPPSLFQMILYESSNQIKCQYADMLGTLIASGGGGATVGLENADGTAGIQYFYQLTYTSNPIHGPLENNLAILFTPGPQVPVFTASTKSVTKNMHPSQTVTYTIGIANDSATPSSISTLTDPIPAGMTYVPGSAQVVGGGLLNATSSHVNWQGTLAPSYHVTVTFGAKLSAPSGLITNTATIDDPQAVLPVAKTALTPVQPVTRFGVGQPLYAYRDSFAPGVSYSWIPTTTASTKMTVAQGDNDDGYGSVPLGFTFPFYDRPYTATLVSTNGLVMFNAGGSTVYKNEPIPTPGTVDNYASCFWDDQIITDTVKEGIWSETFGSAPNRYTVITFVLQDANGKTTQPYRYQIILYEEGRIKCQYAQMSTSVFGNGASATIGLEDRYGISGVQYFTDRLKPPFIGPVQDGLAIEFKRISAIFLPLLR